MVFFSKIEQNKTWYVVVTGLISDVLLDIMLLLSQNLLQFPFSLTNKLFVTMRTPLSPVWLMVATHPPVTFHGSKMTGSSPQQVQKSLQLM